MRNRSPHESAAPLRAGRIVAIHARMARTRRDDIAETPTETIFDPAELTNIGVAALLLVMLLVAGFSMVRQWSVDGLTTAHA